MIKKIQYQMTKLKTKNYYEFTATYEVRSVLTYNNFWGDG